ncbi:cytochrome c biogenesis CcdA family protein [Mariniluteicoccus flavus]
MIDIGYAGALLGGIATILSPCSAMMLPAFFAYAFASTRLIVVRTGIFYLGLLTTLVPLGVAAGSFGALFTHHRGTFVTVAAAAVVVLGLLQALGVTVPLPGRRSDGPPQTGALSVYLLGTVYGIAGTCAGPILGSVLSVAAVGGNAVRGGVLLGIFAAGMVLPLMVLALLWDALDLGRRAWLRQRPVALGPIRTTAGQLVSGLLFVAIGVAMWLTDGFADLGGLVGAEQQQGIEVSILGVAAQVADLVVVLLLVMVTASCVAVHQWASARK